LEAAAQAVAIDEFKLYLAYKGAKEGTRSLWAGLAAPFNVEADRLSELTDENPETLTEEEKQQMHIELLRRFTGYMMWKANVLIRRAGR
jgi:hypothetical protein